MAKKNAGADEKIQQELSKILKADPAKLPAKLAEARVELAELRESFHAAESKMHQYKDQRDELAEKVKVLQRIISYSDLRKVALVVEYLGADPQYCIDCEEFCDECPEMMSCTTMVTAVDFDVIGGVLYYTTPEGDAEKRLRVTRVTNAVTGAVYFSLEGEEH